MMRYLFLTLLLVSCTPRVCIPVFQCLDSNKYIVLSEDTLQNGCDCKYIKYKEIK
jgi:hypothetical protein